MFPQAHIVENEADVALAILAGERISRCKNPAKDCEHWARMPLGDGEQGNYYCVCCNVDEKMGRTADKIPRMYLCDGTRV